MVNEFKVFNKNKKTFLKPFKKDKILHPERGGKLDFDHNFAFLTITLNKLFCGQEGKRLVKR